MDVKLAQCFLAVDDHDKAVAFYRDVLGLEVRNDVGFEGMRWVTLGSPLQPDVEIVLEPPDASPDASPRTSRRSTNSSPRACCGASSSPPPTATRSTSGCAGPAPMSSRSRWTSRTGSATAPSGTRRATSSASSNAPPPELPPHPLLFGGRPAYTPRMTIRWTYAFADRPAARLADACAFWTAVTGTRLSRVPRRPRRVRDAAARGRGPERQAPGCHRRCRRRPHRPVHRGRTGVDRARPATRRRARGGPRRLGRPALPRRAVVLRRALARRDGTAAGGVRQPPGPGVPRHTAVPVRLRVRVLGRADRVGAAAGLAAGVHRTAPARRTPAPAAAPAARRGPPGLRAPRPGLRGHPGRPRTAREAGCRGGVGGRPLDGDARPGRRPVLPDRPRPGDGRPARRRPRSRARPTPGGRAPASPPGLHVHHGPDRYRGRTRAGTPPPPGSADSYFTGTPIRAGSTTRTTSWSGPS